LQEKHSSQSDGAEIGHWSRLGSGDELRGSHPVCGTRSRGQRGACHACSSNAPVARDDGFGFNLGDRVRHHLPPGLLGKASAARPAMGGLRRRDRRFGARGQVLEGHSGQGWSAMWRPAPGGPLSTGNLFLAGGRGNVNETFEVGLEQGGRDHIVLVEPRGFLEKEDACKLLESSSKAGFRDAR